MLDYAEKSVLFATSFVTTVFRYFIVSYITICLKEEVNGLFLVIFHVKFFLM